MAGPQLNNDSAATDTAIDGRQNGNVEDVKIHKTVPGKMAHHAKEAVKTDKAFQPVAAVNVADTQAPIHESQNGVGNGPHIQSTGSGVEVLCGPLLNYRHMSEEHSSNPIWHGSVLLVTQPGQTPGDLTIRRAGEVNGVNGLSNSHAPAQENGLVNGHSIQENGLAHGVTSQQNGLQNGISNGIESSQTNGHANGVNGSSSGDKTFTANKLYEDPTKAFFQWSIDVPFLDAETTWEYSIPQLREKKDQQPVSKPMRFVVASKHESFRIMFHSCNGFSVGTDEEEWSGPALWNDVLRIHEKRPFHIMVGGGDQIYNDGVRVNGPLRPWSDIGNPRKRREFPFNEELRAKCDDYYFDNHVRWYSQKPFSTANGQIPATQIWDDHDIIDGFGSYTDHFMKCHVFRGIGAVAHKYYLLFQHHVPPPVSTFTTDAPHTTKNINSTTPADAAQLKDSFVNTSLPEDPMYLIGKKPGPYVAERSRSLYCQLGKRMAMLGIDARTERTRHQVTYPETYDMVFKHTEEKLAASNGEIKHLILLLGIPIAYPRLQWLENILSSPIIGPVKFLNKRFGFAGGFFNQFDGKPDLLDDLDDHYTSRTHKHERKELILRLQRLSKQFSVRITILGGDVHLAACGRFFSKTDLNIPVEEDFRYMPNIISSAIVNHPPPQAVANLLAKRNKIHHLDSQTDETLLEIFDEDPARGKEGVEPKSASSNHVTMPSRNYAIIAESKSHSSEIASANAPASSNGTTAFQPPKNPREPLSKGESNAGVSHPAADGVTYTGLGGDFGLDVAWRVEIDNHDRQGHTEGYGLSIPALTASAGGAVQEGRVKYL
ncbi:hypothetical protein MRB53_039577 [Persea americana]|nr:hypothetical protein MRB53_039577 [Persea americana]